MKNKRPTFTYPSKIKGFSLIEFLVASALSLIVLIAVTSTYFTARNLNSAATSRLSVQQDLRNASALLVRDARMAGSFGCFNMTNHGLTSILRPKPITPNDGNPFNLANNTTSKGLVPISEGTVSYSGFTQSASPALIFQYGIDDSNPDADLAVASSCDNIAKSDQIKNIDTAKAALDLETSNDKDSMISVMKHIVVAYVVGELGGQKGLYRFQLDDSGSWGEPQFLIKDVDSMEREYLYVDSCPEDIVNAASSTTAQEETFVRRDSLRPDPIQSQEAATPALIRIKLNNGNKVTDSSDNEIQIYNIDATVRGGNVCADRLL